MRISRCVWHPRNYGHAKLLGVNIWRGRGFAFTAGLCDKCAVRIHPAIRSQVVRGVELPKRGCRAIVVVVSVYAVMMTGLLLVARPTPDVLPREFPKHHVAPPREMAPPRVAASHQQALLRREMPPRHAKLSTLQRPVRLAQATHPGSRMSAGRVSLARTSRLTEASTPRTERDLYQAP